MSDTLNEKFEELATEHKISLKEGDPMPSVSAEVIPGTGSDPSQTSDVQHQVLVEKIPNLKLEQKLFLVHNQ